MLKKLFSLWILLVYGLLSLRADTVQLKENAAVIGKIIADKRDQVAVDIGYTVIVIPRNQITQIEKSAAAKKTTRSVATLKSDKPETLSTTTNKSGFYHTTLKSPPQRSVHDLVDQLGEAVVQVRTPGGLGSGFIINTDGYLITNFHVIEGETQISVEVYHQKDGQLDRKSYKQVRIVAINKFEDMALLKIDDKDAPKFVNVLIGDSDALGVGERVFAIGSPLGLERTVTEGILSTTTRQIQGGLYLQTTAQINPGNSGGPLFNMAGEVIGVTNMKITFGEGLGFAIPISEVKFFLDHRDAYAYSNDNPSNPYRYLEPPSRTQKVSTSE